MNLLNATPKQLRKAAKYQAKIEALQAKITALLKPEAVAVEVTVPATAKPGRRKMSSAHKAALKAAQKARWEKYWAKKKAPK